MFYFLNKVQLKIAITIIVVSYSFFQNNFLMANNYEYLSGDINTLQQNKSISETYSQAWKKVASMHYSYEPSQPDGWLLLSKDTIIYDTSGNMTNAKTNRVYIKSLQNEYQESLDSCIYTDNRLIDSIHLEYNESGIPYGGFRKTFEYYQSAITSTEYTLNDSTMEWIETLKDSTNYSVPVIDIRRNNLTNVNMIGCYKYIFDTTSSSWINFSFYNKIDTLSNGVTLFLRGQRSIEQTNYNVDTNEVISYLNADWVKVDAIKVVSFSNADWAKAAITEISEKVIYPPVTGYELYSKTINTSSSSVIESYMWNTIGDSLGFISKYSCFKDSFGNDTANFNILYPSGISAIGTDFHYQRFYDDNGNNIETVTSYNDNNINHIVSKDVNVFAQIKSPVIYNVKSSAKNEVSINISTGIIYFYASNISAVNIYTMSGQRVLSVNQKASSSISLNLSNVQHFITAGTYFAEIVYTHGKTSFKIPIIK